MLLATVLDVPLVQAATISLANGCINVIDINRRGTNRKIGKGSVVFGLSDSQTVEKDFELCIPEGSVVRINENRHLEGIL